MKKISKMFLIDDDPIANFVNKHLVDTLDLTQQLEVFTEAEDAFDYLKNKSVYDRVPELILLDLNMPGFNGFDFIRSLQTLEEEKASEIKIVVLTSSQHEKDMELLKSLGIREVLSKPLTKEKILGII